MAHCFNLPRKDRTAEGWAVIGIVALMLTMLWLVL
jgi:hypothetical protein